LRERHNVKRAAMDEPLNMFASSPSPRSTATAVAGGTTSTAGGVANGNGNGRYQRDDSYESEWYAHSSKPIPQRFVIASREREAARQATLAAQSAALTASATHRPLHGSTVPHAGMLRSISLFLAFLHLFI
jgi:hypothetical protein